MRVLLDTHTFLWWITDADSLSGAARETLADGANEVFLSAVSAWEIAIKAGRGRLTLSDEPHRFVTQQLIKNSFHGLPLHLAHALHVYGLPEHHRDPFDRLLVAQSQLEGLPMVTADAEIARYDVSVIW
jgi:PIN domain nuclease of toxin-antitoxin system